MIYILMLVVFVLGYLAIALEHPLKVDKAASALIIGALGWALYAFSGVDFHHIGEHLSHHVVDIAEILFFLLGAMTIVELVDAHQGFSIITDKINTTKRVPLMWILTILSFFFSVLTLFSKTLIFVLFDWFFILSLTRYFSINFSLTLKPEFFIKLLNHEKLIFANFIIMRGLSLKLPTL